MDLAIWSGLGICLTAFLGWLIASGGDWYHALTIAIAVLIVTCPCALGLAVPVVHVVGAARLFDAGILMKDGSALERLAEIDRVVFDKTGTLTTGTPRLAATDIATGAESDAARALAARSSHPASRAIREGLPGNAEPLLDAVREVPGSGVEARIGGRIARLGRPAWVGEIAAGPEAGAGRETIAGSVAFQIASPGLYNSDAAPVAGNQNRCSEK